MLFSVPFALQYCICTILCMSYVVSLSDVWYVNCDGKEGWVPADLLKEYVDDDLSGQSGESTPASLLSSNPVSSDESEGLEGTYETVLRVRWEDV